MARPTDFRSCYRSWNLGWLLGVWWSGKRLRSRVIEDVSRGTSRGLPRALVAMVADSNPA
jgi:hypothetical protein